MKNYLWQDDDGAQIDQTIMEFMAGEDVVLDRELFPFDIRATAAHVRGLARIGILSADESDTLCLLLEQLQAGLHGRPFRPRRALSKMAIQPSKCFSPKRPVIPAPRFIPGAAATTRWRWQRDFS